MAEFNKKIKERFSVRKFKADSVPDELIKEILETARFAPSGLNNQPWKFIIIKDLQIKEEVAAQTHYSNIICNAPLCIAVFYDKDTGYNYVKDVHAIGAATQNILLAIHNLDLGGVWLGEILNKRQEVERILNVPESFELMAVVALGYPTEKVVKRSRKPLSELVYLNKYDQKWIES
ncbi:MAG: nitroreductase family protein [Candidatus Hodarchaeota archaeon]